MVNFVFFSSLPLNSSIESIHIHLSVYCLILKTPFLYAFSSPYNCTVAHCNSLVECWEVKRKIFMFHLLFVYFVFEAFFSLYVTVSMPMSIRKYLTNIYTDTTSTTNQVLNNRKCCWKFGISVLHTKKRPLQACSCSMVPNPYESVWRKVKKFR